MQITAAHHINET